MNSECIDAGGASILVISIFLVSHVGIFIYFICLLCFLLQGHSEIDLKAKLPAMLVQKRKRAAQPPEIC